MESLRDDSFPTRGLRSEPVTRKADDESVASSAIIRRNSERTNEDFEETTLNSEASVYLKFVAELQSLETIRRQEFLSCLQKTADMVKRVHEKDDNTNVVAQLPTFADKPNWEHPKPTEAIQICSESICKYLNALVEDFPRSKEQFPTFSPECEIKGPYLFYYHNREFFQTKRSDLDVDHPVGLLLDYLSQSVADDYRKIDDLFAQNLVTADVIQYLFAPSTVIVTKSNDYLKAYCQVGGFSISSPKSSSEADYQRIAKLVCESWDYDGIFSKTSTSLVVDFQVKKGAATPSVRAKPTMKIQDLTAYPIRFASESIKTELWERGKKFWECRKQKYILYTGLDYSLNQHYSEARFMIDISAFQKMHPESRKIIGARSPDNLLPPEEANADDPPSGDFLLLLPSNIYGFQMQEKKWANFQVSLIEEVRWHTESFESLVVEPDTKELIIALITNKIEAERATDVISGKENGLVILLHGGPGTGKTLTAESVAEIAQKPLYRVTCGDIGTSSEAVEKYLDTVLTLGHMWKCVVLLDEADVFLEQRTLSDPKRNALVSVFLRVLEYYDGILILTSNRVGTFDEAFKSRIQLALHYDSLSYSQRKQI
ncbi:hypothetical protein VE02_02394 [Pseudogymnoascus sp. 03VT05]|nr:hypothetical protein VE02_02394 [Pseudogymnoascus sp. 03VT05]